MRLDTPGGAVTVALEDLVVAGWPGRDRAAVDHQIAGLAALGVAPPSAVPLFCRVAAGLVTETAAIQVLGPDTSGEVEPLIVNAGGRLYLGLASDHTDRALEAVSVAASKQICAKPVASDLWPWEAVAPHLDALHLRTQIEEGGAWVVYQEGPLAQIRPLGDLLAAADLPEGAAILCGTLGAIGGVRAATRYRMALVDPVRGQEIALRYDVQVLPSVA